MFMQYVPPDSRPHLMLQRTFQTVEERVEQSSDSCEFMLDFWEKMVRIEKEYARSIEDLCLSRYAQLFRLFQTQSIEPIA